MAILRGLCGRALPVRYETIEDEVVLDRGLPVPFATRPIVELFDQTTPHWRTLSRGDILEGLGFRLFTHSLDEKVQVVLDFRHRERLDELTWSGAERLPSIATLHPFLGEGAIAIGTRSRSAFFDVGPADWDRTDVLAQLEQVRQAQIAVLPELCLPTPDALEAALAAEPERYPSLIVAGSAHIRQHDVARDREIRANESRVYLDGELVAVHHKIHRFATKDLPGQLLDRPLDEDITQERKTIRVLSGRYTRLAVVICADLNDQDIPWLLAEAGVNLLLVPALTPSVGAFNAAATGIASHCQGVAVIVNARLDPATGKKGHEPTFLVLAAVPRERHEDQLATYPSGSDGQPTLGVIDPNLPLAAAMTWVRES